MFSCSCGCFVNIYINEVVVVVFAVCLFVVVIFEMELFYEHLSAFWGAFFFLEVSLFYQYLHK